MNRVFSKGWGLLVVLILGMTVIQTRAVSKVQNQIQKPGMLSAADKDELTEVLRLKAKIGDQVWPGLAKAAIPIILYDENHEFLVGESNPEGRWEVVKGDDVRGRPYYCRPAKDPQAFAVSIGRHWAGSIGTLDWMNRKSPLKISPEFHVVLLLHEVFHAYQAEAAPAHFAAARAVYSSENLYLFQDQEFAAAWNNEGSVLAEALKTLEESSAVSLARDFLKIRDARRERFALSADLLTFERELEWLEGLAEYVEIRFYETAAAHSGEPAFARYGTALPLPLQWDFVRLERQLGRQNEDLRFYLSGMAQARLLDRLNPGWKDLGMNDKAYLEDILRAVVASK
jgi:hypothetical protein